MYCLCFFLVQLRVARCASSCAASTAGHSQISNFIPQHNTTQHYLFFLSRYITTFLDASGSSPHHKPPSFHTFVSFALFTIPPYHSRHHLIFLHLACYLLAHNQVMRSKLRGGVRRRAAAAVRRAARPRCPPAHGGSTCSAEATTAPHERSPCGARAAPVALVRRSHDARAGPYLRGQGSARR